MQAIPCRRALACAYGSSSSSSSSSSSGSSSSSSRHRTVGILLQSSAWPGADARRSALPLPAVRISCSRTRSRVQGVSPLRDQAHELPASWHRSLNLTQSDPADNPEYSYSSSNTRANGKDIKSSGNTGPVQSFQALFQQQHAAGHGSSSMQRLASLRFSIVRAVEYGQKLRLVGSPDCLGAWDAEQGPNMKWNEGHKWTASVELAAGSHEFKYVTVHRSGELEWEPGSNRVLEVPATAAEMQVAGQWGDTADTETLELQQQPVVSDRRRRQQQLVQAAEVATADGAVEPAAAVAAAQAADALWSVLDLDEQSQMQPPPRNDSAVDAAATQSAGGVSQQQIDLLLQVMKSELGSARTAADAAAAATAAVDAAAGAGAGNGVPTPQQIQQLMQALRAELTPAAATAPAAAAPAAAAPTPAASTAAHNSSSSIVMSPAGAAADVASAVQLDAQLATHNNKLVSTLLEMRSELVSSINEVTAAMQEVQDELAEVQQYVTQLATERFMMMMQQQQQQQQGLGAAGAAAVAAAALQGIVGAEHGDATAWRDVERQLMAQQADTPFLASSSTDATAAAGSVGQSSWKIRWNDGISSSSSDDMQPALAMAAVRAPAVVSRVRPAVELDFASAGAAAMSLAGNLQLSPAVLTWRQEVLQFRQESKVLRSELHGLNDVLDSMQQQLVANSAAIHNLQAAVLSDESSSSGTAGKPEVQAAADLAAAVAAAAAEAGELSTGGSSSTGDSSHLQEQLLSKFDQLAVDLKEEVKHAVQAVAAAKQPPQPVSRQPISFDDFVSQLWTAPPPQELPRQRQQQQQQHTDHHSASVADGPSQHGTHGSSSSSSTAREEAAAVVQYLGSPNVQQYHKGVLVCVMIASGVWEEGLLDIIRGTAMRTTWRAYKAVWSDELMFDLKQRLTSPQAVLAELQRSSSSADELACHMLWSLQELSTHSTRVALLLKRVYSSHEAALMQRLAPGARQQQCAAILLRWMAGATM